MRRSEIDGDDTTTPEEVRAEAGHAASRAFTASRGSSCEPYQVVLRPLVTEKGTHQSTRYNAYAFQVNPLATKTQIKAAVEELFNVRVEGVRTQIRHGQEAPVPQQRWASCRDWKKAIVTLHAEDKIEFF